MQFLVHNISDHKENQKLLETFKAIDKDQSGTLTLEELKEALQLLKFDQKELHQLLNSIDLDEYGNIEYSSFCAAAIDAKTFLNEQNLLFAFHHFDINSTGHITFESLLEALHREGRDVTS